MCFLIQCLIYLKNLKKSGNFVCLEKLEESHEIHLLFLGPAVERKLRMCIMNKSKRENDRGKEREQK